MDGRYQHSEKGTSRERHGWSSFVLLPLGVTVFLLPILAGCRIPPPPPPVPEPPPTLVQVSADLEALCQTHPSWQEAQAIRDRLQELGIPPVEIEQTVWEAHGDPAQPLPEQSVEWSEPAVSVGDREGTLDETLSRHYRESPWMPLGEAADPGQAAEPISDVQAKPTDWKTTIEDRRTAEAEKLTAEQTALLQAYGSTLPVIEQQGDQGPDPLERVKSEVALEAESSAARLRQQVPLPVGPANKEPADPAQEAGPSTSEVSQQARRRMRETELQAEAEKLLRRERAFAERGRDALQLRTPSVPRWEALSPELAIDPVPSNLTHQTDDVAELRARYAALLEEIARQTKSQAQVIARAAGYQLSFSGQGPDRTAELASRLREFYAPHIP